MDQPANALIVGADSLIGAALTVELKSRGAVVRGTSRRRHDEHFFLDLSRPLDRRALPEADTVYLCAGINGYAACSEDPATAATVNIAATVAVGRHYLQSGAHVVFISSTAVFGARSNAPNEEDAASPDTIYGAYKRATEIGLLETAKMHAGQSSIVRLTKVLAANNGLLKRWRALSRDGGAIDAFADVFVSPLSPSYVASALVDIGERRSGGVFHLAGEQILSYAELGSSLGERGMLPTNLINSVTAAGTGQARVLSQCASLGMTRTCSLAGVQPQPLKDFLQSLEAQS